MLAVGVDNIFILVEAYASLDRTEDDTRSQLIGRAVGSVGPSMLLSSISQSCCFFLGNERQNVPHLPPPCSPFLCSYFAIVWRGTDANANATNDFPCCFAGALSDMPAVQAFAMYAGMSLLINFVLQMTLFVALFSLDVAREEVRLDLSSSTFLPHMCIS